MADKSWMLNPKAIQCAKECILIVQEELNIRLKLSHPDFIELLHDYVELTESQHLRQAVAKLMSFAGASYVMRTHQLAKKSNKVINMASKRVVGGEAFFPRAVEETAEAAPPQEKEIAPMENVVCGGRVYPKYRDGKEFKGLYRGQPRYL